MHYISQAHAYLINPSKIHHKCTKVQHHKFIITSSTSLLWRRRLQVWPPDCGEGPDRDEGLTRSAAGDTVAGLFEPADGGCTKEKRLHVLDSKLKISTAPPLHGTKADNPNGTKADNPNGTKAENPNGTNALNFHTHRSEVSNRSWSWQLHLDTRCLPDGLHDLVHVRHLLLRGLQLYGQVRLRLLCLCQLGL